MNQIDVADKVTAETKRASPAYVPPLQRTEGQPPPIAANGGLSYMAFDQDGDAGTAKAIGDALAEIADGEGQRVIDMIDQAPPGPIKTQWGLAFRDYDECVAYIRSSNSIKAPAGGVALPLPYTVYERPTYSVVPSNAIWRDPARADAAAILRQNEQDNRRRNLFFPQVLRDARRIGEYYPGLSPNSPECMDRLGLSLAHLESRCTNIYDPAEVERVFYPEIERYLNYVADKFDLRRDIRFRTTVTAAHYQEDSRSWKIMLDDGTSCTARFLVTAIGVLSASVLPRIPGIESFQGQSCHTHNWPKEPVSFDGKRVAVIGTGATGIQAITEIAKTAGHLTVFQRTAQWSAPLHNAPVTPEEMREIRSNYAEIFARCQETLGCFIHTADPRSVFEVTEEEREAFWEQRYGEPGFGIWMGNFRDVLVDREANRLMSDYLARKIRQRVKDPAVAEKLVPRTHGFGTRRVPLESGYFEVYNQPNVKLVDLAETPIERITPAGIRTSDADYEFDMIVYATGFDAITGAFDRIDFRGVGGTSLKDKWADGPVTLLGILVDGFPNFLMVMGPHAGLGNFPRAVEYTSDWVTALIRHARDNGITRVDATPEAAKAWTDHVIETNEGLLFTEVDSWMTGINRNLEGKQVRRVMRYSGGHPAFRQHCEAISAGGYRELSMA